MFEIAKAANGYASTPTTLVSFNGTNGSSPHGLVADADGNLFATTSHGGAYGQESGGYGTVFEITKTASGYASTPTTLVSFNGTNGEFPGFGSLIADADGNLFGTTIFGGAYGYGTVFEIAKTASGYASIPITLVSFDGTNGAAPYATLMADARGNLFGTTSFDGAGYTPGANLLLQEGGTVFEITGSGFVPPPLFAGTPGAPNCHGQSVSALAQQYGGLNNAAADLGYSSVSALQDAIMAYCEG